MKNLIESTYNSLIKSFTNLKQCPELEFYPNLSGLKTDDQTPLTPLEIFMNNYPVKRAMQLYGHYRSYMTVYRVMVELTELSSDPCATMDNIRQNLKEGNWEIKSLVADKQNTLL